MWPLTGCAFAARFAGSSEALLFYEIICEASAVDTDEIADFMDRAGIARRVAVLLGPDMRNSDEIATLLRVLAEHPRWAIQSKPELARDDGEVGVCMTWTTSAGQTTHAMGFAPLAYMPASRRGPFPAIAAWTGGHENPHRTNQSPDHVIVGDAPPPDGDYDGMMTKTRDRSKQLRCLESIGRKNLRQLGFRLDRRAIERVFPALLAAGT